MSGKGTGNNKILAEELHKSVIKKFNKRKVYLQFRDNIWGVDLADMQSLSKRNKSIKYLFCAIDLYSKYAFVVPLKDKKGISIVNVNAFNTIIKQSNRKQNKMWVDQGSEFYNRVFKKWLLDNDIIMYSTFNEGKSVVAERFIRTLKNKLYKHMKATGKNVYYDVLDDVVNEYNNTKHNTIKMKPKDVKNDNKRVYIDEHNEKVLDIMKAIELEYPPYKSSSNNIKVELDLSNYATKNDLKNIMHLDVRSFASKTNLAALKTEVDKIDVYKLKTTPVDLAKLTNAVENDLVKKTDYNNKVTSIETQIAGLTKYTVDNLADITKLKAIDTNSFVLKTKLTSDVTTLENKTDTVDKKIPDISGLATKTSLTSYLQTATFNSKVTEVENKIKAADIIAKSANTKANTIRSDLTGYAKKVDVATDITTIKNDYVTNASLASQLNDLKNQHIATEVMGIDNKTKKNARDILVLENKLQQKDDTINENERGLSFNRGFFYYLQQSHFVYECRTDSFNYTNKEY